MVMSSDTFCLPYLDKLGITIIDREREIVTLAAKNGITIDDIGLERIRNNPQLGAQLIQKILQDIRNFSIKPMYKQQATLEALCKRNPKLLDDIHACLASIPGEGYVPSFDRIRVYGKLSRPCVYSKRFRV